MQKAYSFVTSRYIVAAFALLVAVLMIVATTSPALAYGRYNRGGDSDVRISNDNDAHVGNVVIVGANTGHNSANGGDGDEGGEGGDASGKNANAGDGGNGGDGGDSGDIDTGDAISTALVTNDVNRNTTVVDSCGCEGQRNRNNGDVRVSNDNDARVHNFVVVGSNTGGNVSNGGDGDEGGEGGDAENNTRRSRHWWGNHGEANAGDGGNGGDGGDSGDIDTGDADSLAQVVNVVNRSVTRVQR